MSSLDTYGIYVPSLVFTGKFDNTKHIKIAKL